MVFGGAALVAAGVAGAASSCDPQGAAGVKDAGPDTAAAVAVYGAPPARDGRD